MLRRCHWTGEHMGRRGPWVRHMLLTRRMSKDAAAGIQSRVELNSAPWLPAFRRIAVRCSRQLRAAPLASDARGLHNCRRLAVTLTRQVGACRGLL